MSDALEPRRFLEAMARRTGPSKGSHDQADPRLQAPQIIKQDHCVTWLQLNVATPPIQNIQPICKTSDHLEEALPVSGLCEGRLINKNHICNN